MSDDTRGLLDDCRGAGLGEAVDTLSLLAIDQRKAAVALAEAKRNFEGGRLALVALARQRGINVPPQISAEAIANTLA